MKSREFFIFNINSSGKTKINSSINLDLINGSNVYDHKGLPFKTLNCFLSPNLMPDPAAGIIADTLNNFYHYT